MTMDILWAISQAPATPIPNRFFPGSPTASGIPAMPAVPRVDESWEAHHFVGGVQFWGYGLVSGSGDGAVRMWDSESLVLVARARGKKTASMMISAVRTGQAHRTLLGHTAPVTCLQFDEIHIVTGSLDKCIRVRWPMVLGCCGVLTFFFSLLLLHRSGTFERVGLLKL
jgi:division protein 1